MSRAWMKSAPKLPCPVCRRPKPVTPRGTVAPHFIGGFGQCPGGGRPAP